MWFGVITLFPETLNALTVGITGRALKDQRITLNCWNPRDFCLDKHKTVDDKPYGGGPGMVMRAEPLLAAIEVAKQAAPTPAQVIYLSPQGQLFTQALAERATLQQSYIFLAGRYEGIDQRVIDCVVDGEWSIGNYILSGGELPVMVVIDAIARLLPGVVGDITSVEQDSLTRGLLKYPQYTRPEWINGRRVPEVLLSGDHARIQAWREATALTTTQKKRPDLLTHYPDKGCYST